MKNEEKILNPDYHNRILLKAKSKAKWNTIITLLSIILLCIPILYVCTIIFYSLDNRANKEILAVETLYALTDPTLQIDDSKVKSDLSPFFEFHIQAPIVKKLGTKMYRVGTYNARSRFGHGIQKYVDLNIPEESHQTFPYTTTFDDILANQSKVWETLETVPKGTTAEVFILLNNTYSQQDVQRIFAKNDLHFIWNAVDTGLESTMLSAEGSAVTLIGFPTVNKAPENSNFKANSNEELFIEQLRFVKENEKLFDDITGQYKLAADERLAYVESNGISIYGFSAIASVDTLLELQSMKEIQGIQITSLGLWK